MVDLKQALRESGKLTDKEMDMLKASYDIVGDIAIIDIDKALRKKEKIIAWEILKLNRHVKTVARKVGIHTGELRLQKTKVIAGENKKETVHKESRVMLRLNIDKVYFSVRLSTERLRIASLIKDGETVLVMFSGCGPYVCVFAKNTKAKEIYGIEKNKTGHRYAEENVRLNRITDARLFYGDVRKIMPKFPKRLRFGRIVMPLPKGGGDFLDLALSRIKKGGTIHFYDFLREEEIPDAAIKKIEKACKEAGKRFKVLHWNRCGSNAPRKYRVCVDFKAIG